MPPPAVLAGTDPPPPATAPRAGLRGRVAADPGAATVGGAALLIVLQLGLRAWASSGGYFLLDDFVFVTRAAQEPLWPRLFSDYNGHLMPAAFVLVDALTALTPLSWAAVVGLEVAGQLAVDVAMLALLVGLFGRRPAVLVPLAVFLTSSITLPAYLWWAAALNQLPMQLAVLLALGWHVRYLRTGTRRYAVAAAAAVLAGLAFSEKTLLAVPLLAALTVGWFAMGGPLARLADTWHRHRFGWLLQGGLAAAYTGYYLVGVSSPVVAAPTAGDAVELLVPQLWRSVLPGLVGGPWRWEDFPPTLALTDPPLVAQVLAAAAAGLVVAVSVASRRGALRAWVLLAGYLAGVCLLISSSRAQIIGPFALAREYRYVTDVALVAALCLGLAFLPVRDAPTVLRERRGRLPAALRRVGAVPVVAAARPAAGAALVMALLAGSVVSTVDYTRRWWANPARPFVQTALAELADRPDVTLVDAPVPDAVLWSALGRFTQASSLLAAAPGRRAFLRDGLSAGSIAMLDEAGHVQVAVVVPQATAPPGPAPDCGWLVADGPVSIPLDHPAGPGRWVVRLAYLSAIENAGWVIAGGQRAPVWLPAGLHQTFVQVTGPVTEVTLEPADPTRPVCVGQVEVGTARPFPGGPR